MKPNPHATTVVDEDQCFITQCCVLRGGALHGGFDRIGLGYCGGCMRCPRIPSSQFLLLYIYYFEEISKRFLMICFDLGSVFGGMFFVSSKEQSPSRHFLANHEAESYAVVVRPGDIKLTRLFPALGKE